MRNIYKAVLLIVAQLFFVGNTFSQVNFSKVDSLIHFLSSDNWIWINSTGGFSGNDIYSPKEFMKNKILKFKKITNAMDSIAYELYYDKSLAYKGSSKVSFSSSIFGTTWNIENLKGFTTKQQSFTQVKHDKISFSDNCSDCIAHRFMKQSLTDFTFSVTGINTTTLSGYIESGDRNFSYTGVRKNQMVSFYVTTFKGYSYKWKFGDGDSSNLASPIHSFESKSILNTGHELCYQTLDDPTSAISCYDNFIVSLTITDANGQSLELSKTLSGINYFTESKSYTLLTGISDNIHSQIKIFDLVEYYKINFQNLHPNSIKIYSITGQQILTETKLENEITINKTELSSGLNIVYLDIQGYGKYFKLMK